MANIAIKNNFKVGTKVRVYCPYGSFEYEDTVTAVSPKGMSISVGESKYKPLNNNFATNISRWGIGTITVIATKWAFKTFCKNLKSIKTSWKKENIMSNKEYLLISESFEFKSNIKPNKKW